MKDKKQRNNNTSNSNGNKKESKLETKQDVIGQEESFGKLKHVLHESSPGHIANFQELNADCTEGVQKAKILEESRHLEQKFAKLQENLYLARSNSILIILQGMDTAGKDSTIRRVMTSVNPAGCRVESFKVPTPEEKNHDYLWRIHKVTPEKGNISVFNRSHYEEVLITRINGTVNDTETKRRFLHINNFEKLLTDNKTIVIKIFLHISKDEQKRRLVERGTSKPWKLEAADWTAHESFDKYMTLYNDVFRNTSTDYAPWYIIPSNKKWFRDFAIRHLLVTIMERYYEHTWKNEIIKLTQTHPPAPVPSSSLPSSIALPESSSESNVEGSPVSLVPTSAHPHQNPHSHPNLQPHQTSSYAIESINISPIPLSKL